MTKLILIAVAVVAVVWLLRRAVSGPGPRNGDAPPQAPGEAKGDLVSCAHCGVNLPKAEAYAARGAPPGTGSQHPGAGGRHYCSEEHWRAGPRDG
jgi:hypothetical protein